MVSRLWNTPPARQIRDLYRDMNEEQLAEAEANLKAYVAALLRIYDRLKAEGKPWPRSHSRPDLTVGADDPMIPLKRSNCVFR